MKKILSFLVAAAMFLVLMPTVAFAQAAECDVNGVTYTAASIPSISVANLNTASLSEVNCIFDEGFMENIPVPKLQSATDFWNTRIQADAANFLIELANNNQTDIFHRVLLKENSLSSDTILNHAKAVLPSANLTVNLVGSGYGLYLSGSGSNSFSQNGVTIEIVHIKDANSKQVASIVLDGNNLTPTITVDSTANRNVVVVHATDSSNQNMMKALRVRKGDDGVKYCGDTTATIVADELNCPIDTEIASLAQISAGHNLADDSRISTSNGNANFAVIVGPYSGASSYIEPPLAAPEFSDYMLILTFLIAGYAMRKRLPELQAIVAGK